MTPVYIDEIITDCVAKASTKLLPSLQAVDSNIQQIHFEHGHPLEIIGIMKSMSEAIAKKPMRYPLVALFRDFPQKPKQGFAFVANVQIFIMTRTKPEYYSNQRKEKSFKPILYPILNELIHQMELSGKFLFDGGMQNSWDEQIDHYFWGRESVFGSQANIFSDWIDCIEIKNLNLKTYLKNC